MIYKLDQVYLVDSDSSGLLNFICMSSTGLYFLTQGESLPDSITCIEEFEDQELQSLLENPEWIQPSED